MVSEGNIHVDGTVEGDVQTGHLTIGSSGCQGAHIWSRGENLRPGQWFIQPLK